MDIQCSDFMKLRVKVFLIFVIFSLGIFFTSYRIVNQKVLIIENIDTDTKVTIPVPYRVFTLSFVHSVQKTPVYEYFRISDDNTLILERTKYYSLGVGLPYTEENGSFRNDDGAFIVNLNREFDMLPIRVSPIPEHNITIGNKTYPLLDFAEPENLLNFKAIDRLMIINITRKERENE